MKILKKSVLSIALILVLSIPLLISTIQPASAAVDIKPPYTTFAYISAVPSPIGVNERALVTFRVDQPAYGAVANSGHFNGTTVTIFKPDNKTETKGPMSLDATSSGWFMYIPNQVGTYYFQFHFPQQQYWVNSSRTQAQYTYLADDSEKVPLVVQQDPVPGYNGSPPIPTDFWARPINAENKGWYGVADNWLLKGYDETGRAFAGVPAFAPFTSAPQSAHILWKKPIIPGGIAGGILGDTSYYTGISYEQFFEAMILQGVIFYSEHGLTSTTNFGTRFMDLYTGKDYPLMYMNTTNVNFAQIVNTNNPNEHGAIPYLVITGGSNWLFYEMLPDMQGAPRLRFNLTGMSGLTGLQTIGPNGEILSFNMGSNATHQYISMFNSSRAVLGLRAGFLETWSPSGTINASRRLSESPGQVTTAERATFEAMSNSIYMGIEWNVTFAKPMVANMSVDERLVNFNEGWLLATGTDSSGFPYNYYDVGIDIGRIAKQRSAAGAYPSTISPSFAFNRTMVHDIHDRTSNHIMDGAYVRFDEGEEVLYAFNMNDGSLRWQSEPWNNAWGLFTRCYELAYGLVITSGFDGIVRAYNLTNGNLQWSYYKGSSGFENAYGSYPEYAGFTIADHTVYSTADEHSSDGVLWRGSQLWAINTDTGKLTWKINGMYRHPIIADGILVALNSYDGAVYAFGRGPSKTTVTAPRTVIAKGTGVILTGTVTDQTPSSKDTPAISDASMGQWMEYLYMQKTIPGDATGVDVTLTAIAPSGATENIGTVKSDMAGNFGIIWTPKEEGKYTVMATFAGSNAYGGSFGTTYVGVGPAAAAPEVQTPTPPPTTQPPVITPTPTVSPSQLEPPQKGPDTGLYVGIAAVVVIAVIAAIALILRRRK